MTSKEAEKLVNEKLSEAEVEARRISRRWEIEPDIVAYENATGKLEHLKGFLSGSEKTFNAYFMTEEPTHALTLRHFQRELNRLSRELEYGPIEMPLDAEEEFEVLGTPTVSLKCDYTRYNDGSICGVRYHAEFEGEQQGDQQLFVPESAILGDSISIQSVA